MQLGMHNPRCKFSLLFIVELSLDFLALEVQYQVLNRCSFIIKLRMTYFISSNRPNVLLFICLFTCLPVDAVPRDPGNQQQIYSRLQIYPDPALANAWLLGDLPDDKNYDLAGINISSYSTEPPGNPPPGAVDSAMRVQLSAPIGTSFNYIRVYQQQLQMMDYGPRWSAAMAQPGAWHFDTARDLDHMCVKCR
jgi:hypothetical protein